MEWKLFDGDAPYFSQPGFFAAHPWVPPENQAGHAQRQAMVAGLIHELLDHEMLDVGSISDLGCGDGSLLTLLREYDFGIPIWGYDLGAENRLRAAELGVDVREADILTDQLDYGDLIIASEVVEHLAEPEKFLRSLPDCDALVLSSPSAETGDWHYGHHAWAWDMNGYADLVRRCGWKVTHQVECDGGVNWHGGITREQRFQAIAAER